MTHDQVVIQINEHCAAIERMTEWLRAHPTDQQVESTAWSLVIEANRLQDVVLAARMEIVS